jgi:hypothetical protein
VLSKISADVIVLQVSPLTLPLCPRQPPVLARAFFRSPFFDRRRSHLRATHFFEQEVLYPFRPPSDAAAAQAYFDIVKSGKGNGYTKPAEDSEGKPYLEELATRLGMPHISFGCATNDGYFGSFGYGNALLSRYREHPPAPWALGIHFVATSRPVM